MDGATRLAVLVDAACLAPDGTPLSGAWAVWRAVTATLSALPADGRWSFRLFGGQARPRARLAVVRAVLTRSRRAVQGEAAPPSSSGGCALSSFHARDSGCVRGRAVPRERRCSVAHPLSQGRGSHASRAAGALLRGCQRTAGCLCADAPCFLRSRGERRAERPPRACAVRVGRARADAGARRTASHAAVRR